VCWRSRRLICASLRRQPEYQPTRCCRQSIALPSLRPQTASRTFGTISAATIFYRLVWTLPVSEIAARLGVSDVGLAKLCRRAAVPIPGRGYWQRTEAGQPVEPTPLEVAPKGLPELLRIRGTKPATSRQGRVSTAGTRAQNKAHSLAERRERRPRQPRPSLPCQAARRDFARSTPASRRRASSTYFASRSMPK
jgi:hypothetical protein